MDNTDTKFLIDAVQGVSAQMAKNVTIQVDDGQLDSILPEVAKPIAALTQAVVNLEKTIALAVIASSPHDTGPRRVAKEKLMVAAGLKL